VTFSATTTATQPPPPPPWRKLINPVATKPTFYLQRHHPPLLHFT